MLPDNQLIIFLAYTLNLTVRQRFRTCRPIKNNLSAHKKRPMNFAIGLCMLQTNCEAVHAHNSPHLSSHLM